MESNSAVGARKSVATDVDDLVNMGYPIEQVKQALNVTQGDRTAALRLLSKGEIRKEDSRWRKTTADDWVDGVSSGGVSVHEENRALQKSPIYIRVSAYVRKSYDVEYILKVTLKNGRQWEVARTYNQFSVLKGNLPLGTTFRFKSAFPMPSFIQLFLNEESAEFLEKRRDALGEWIRELTLNEECMSNPKVLELLHQFIEFEARKGAQKVKSPASSSSSGAVAHAVNSPLLMADSNEVDIRKNVLATFPIIDESRFPLPPGELRSLLPFRVELSKLECGRQHIEVANKMNAKLSAGHLEAAASAPASDAPMEKATRRSSRSDIDMKQLSKDLSRDRIVIQGRKVSGFRTEVDEIVEIAKGSMMQAIVRSGHHLIAVKQAAAPPPPPPPGNYLGPGGGSDSAQPSLIGHLGARQSSLSAIPPPPPPPPAPATGAASGDALQVLSNVVKAAMQQISRTESAFLSHTSLHEILDLENQRQLADFVPFLIVPESTLAQPLVLNFRVQERNLEKKLSSSNMIPDASSPGGHIAVASPVESHADEVVRAVQPAGYHSAVSPAAIPVVALPHHPSAPAPVPAAVKEWCVVCEGEASTVYRVTDPETMKPLVQLRVTFVYTLFAIPVFDATNSKLDRVVDFKLKEGKTYLVISQDTTSTDRDW